ncbi:hypothetical protein HFD88_008176 [Aspergillus terreus]|nr:hypothetical protein HFD88_008176 [Aspergillus terreus]
MTAILQQPFQAINFVERGHATNLFVTSAGAKLYSYAAETGERLASWPQGVDADRTEAAEAEVSPGSQGPPEKRRKVSQSSAQAVESSKSTTNDSAKKLAWSNIPIVVISSNGEYVVAVTSEDKCIRVFQLSPDGRFKQLSERCMPKRPCAVVLANDETILVGDKFGDVYSLPLIPGDKPYVPAVSLRGKTSEGPAATNLTVHTKRNLKSLQQQLEQKQEKQANEKTTLNFEHQIVLGHVSMLTDIAFVSLPSSSQKRTYLLSADRDEHIRVSRGPPQAHIIENYCLGHTAFVTKLCIPQWAPEYLISGGGDNFLLVWKWAEGQVLQKVPLVDPESDATIAVRGIWAASLGASDASRMILVSIEGSSKLRSFVLGSDGTLNEQASIQASGNIVDVATVDKDSTVFVSVDSIRKADSTQEWSTEPSSTLLEAFSAKSEAGSVTWGPCAKEIVAKINSTGTEEVSAATDVKQQKELNESLYNLGSLRKRGGEE